MGPSRPPRGEERIGAASSDMQIRQIELISKNKEKKIESSSSNLCTSHTNLPVVGGEQDTITEVQRRGAPLTLALRGEAERDDHLQVYVMLEQTGKFESVLVCGYSVLVPMKKANRLPIKRHEHKANEWPTNCQKLCKDKMAHRTCPKKAPLGTAHSILNLPWSSPTHPDHLPIHSAHSTHPHPYHRY
ncbi:hypothetical protein RB195_004971 [Necator americanus]|uniref:Uncharacterized protein n=1 Tax=Necator americanus TaxID=51031 RepID=A0ABR1BPT4_NECAM